MMSFKVQGSEAVKSAVGSSMYHKPLVLSVWTSTGLVVSHFSGGNLCAPPLICQYP